MTRYQYDQAGNQVVLAAPDSSPAVTEHDGLGRVTRTAAYEPSGSVATPDQRKIVPYGDQDFGVRFHFSGANLTTANSWASGEVLRFFFSGNDKDVHYHSIAKPETGWIEVRVTGNDAANLPLLMGATLPSAQKAMLLSQTLTTYDGDANGRSVYTISYRSIDGAGESYKTKEVFDKAGRPIKTYAKKNGAVAIGDNDILSANTYDALGQLTSADVYKTSSSKLTTKHEYDVLGRDTLTTGPDPDGAGSLASPVTRREYDAVGNRVWEIDPLGSLDLATHPLSITLSVVKANRIHARQYEYDHLNRLTAVSEADPDAVVIANGTYSNGAKPAPKTLYEYDANGNLKKVTDPAGNVIERDYDALDRLSEERATVYLDSANTEEEVERTYQYFDNGNLKQVTDRNGRVHTFTYDALNRVTAEQGPDGWSMSFAYDLAGRLKNGDGDIGYTYDGVGRAKTYEDERANVTLTRELDLQGNVKSVSAKIANAPPAGGGQKWDFKNEYQYNHLAQLERVKQSGAGTGATVPVKGVLFSSNLIGQPNTVRRFDNPGNWTAANPSNEVAAAKRGFDYDQAGRLTSINKYNAGAATAEYGYQYDVAGRITKFTADGNARAYTLDPNDQLTSDPKLATTNKTIAYDNNGNRTSTGGVSSTVGAGNRLKFDGTWYYRYDAEGNLINKATFDITENNYTNPPTAGGTKVHYRYDQRNRLTQVNTSVANAAGVVSEDEAVYTYDILDRRIRKDVTPASGSQVHEQYVYDYDSNDVVLVLDGNNLSSVKSRFLFADGEVMAEDLNGTTTRWLITDHQESVRKVLSLNGSTTVATYDYDAFGNVISTAKPERYAYAGYLRDAETGLYYCMARYYDPKQGRFLSEDPIGADGSGTNLHAYVGNNPVNLSDPSGLSASGGTNFGYANTLSWNGPGYSGGGNRAGQAGMLADAGNVVSDSYNATAQAIAGQRASRSTLPPPYKALEIDDPDNAYLSAMGRSGRYTAGQPWMQGGETIAALKGVRNDNMFIAQVWVYPPAANVAQQAYHLAQSREVEAALALSSIHRAAGVAQEGLTLATKVLPGVNIAAATYEVKNGQSFTIAGQSVSRLDAGIDLAASVLPFGLSTMRNVNEIRNGYRLVSDAAITAEALRNTRGIVTMSQPLSRASGMWLDASRPTAIPAQVAEKLVGQRFNTFGDLRAGIWRTVAADDELKVAFSAANRGNINKGYAPFAPTPFRTNASDAGMRFNLHHVQTIESGGSVYDLSNLHIVSPKVHDELHL